MDDEAKGHLKAIRSYTGWVLGIIIVKELLGFVNFLLGGYLY